MKGLSFRKTADAIATFVNEHGTVGPRRALFCTYDLSPARFEAVLLPVLTRPRRWFRTLVLADGATLQQSGVLSQREAGSTYELAPVRLKGPGVFHPKLIVLQAGERLLVGIGSGNLTPGGLGGNLELMLFASTDTTDGRALAESAIQFLYDLRRTSAVRMPTSARRFLERICLSNTRSAGGPVLHNLDKPLISRLRAGRPSQIQSAILLSPWHSSSASPEGIEPSVLKEVGGALGARPAVYTEGQNGRGPALGKQSNVRILKQEAPDLDEDVDTELSDSNNAAPAPRRPTTLHAKAYLAEGKRAATLWFGSANCTTPALLGTASGLGNVELLVRIALGKSGVAKFRADLESMFEDSRGDLPPAPQKRIPTPRGSILSGYASNWDKQPTMRFDVLPSPVKRTLIIGRSQKRAVAVTLSVPAGASTAVIDRTATVKLLGEFEAPALLWEYVDRTAIPFPVSVPCVPIVDNPDQALDEILDDFAGRLPAAFSSIKRRTRLGGVNGLDEEHDDEHDRELDLLTKTKHQGSLDRIAVRVELLRRRLAAKPGNLAETRAHYRDVIDHLRIGDSLRRILIDHIGGKGTTK
jgi:hypothetical protein